MFLVLVLVDVENRELVLDLVWFLEEEEKVDLMSLVWFLWVDDFGGSCGLMILVLMNRRSSSWVDDLGIGRQREEELQIADMFTKAHSASRFRFLTDKLSMIIDVAL